MAGNTHKIDDITLVAALLCDSRVSVVNVVAEDHPNQKSNSAHCYWVLLAEMGDTEFEKICKMLKVGKGRTSEKVQYGCPNCGMDWVDRGPCDSDCHHSGPDFYRFDESKRVVIEGLREARQALANKRGEGKLYGQ